MKRRLELFSEYTFDAYESPEGLNAKIASKVHGEYRNMKEVAAAAALKDLSRKPTDDATEESSVRHVLDSVPPEEPVSSLVIRENKSKKDNQLILLGASDFVKKSFTAVTSRRKAIEPVKPKWHAPWKIAKVIAGHVGWVRCVSVDPSNEFFFTGSNDRTIKCWDLASGKLKLTLTGHSHSVRGLASSSNHPYLFSVGDDKTVKCWDLETNQVIRNYHGHLQGIHCVAVHPQLDVLMTGSRDASVRVWDMRTRKEVHLLTGHSDSIEALITQSSDPQIISGSMDKTVKLWDLAAGKVLTTLTNHSKGVRALARSPLEYSFVSASADCLKKWECRDGRLMLNMFGHKGIVNAVAVNRHDVMFSGGDDGSVRFWDWSSGHCFMSDRTIPQPGSLDSEACVLAASFDHTGTRLITCEADKSVKIWKEDADATPDSFPLTWSREQAAEEQMRERY